MKTQHQLVRYARSIARYQGYTHLLNGLQPLEQLRLKFQQEVDEFQEALRDKSWLHLLHEAADLLYYAAQRTEQGEALVAGQTCYENTIEWLKIHLVQATVAQAEQAALAKYRWRAEKPGNKDEQYELALIEAACSSSQQAAEE
jgi:phosphoribosyl-ATP pyrophosphohydrolase